MIPRTIAVALSLVLLGAETEAFFPNLPLSHHRHVANSVLFAATADDVSSMRAGAIKAELESYGISTKSFLEKSELVEALTKARADGLKPKATAGAASSTSASSASTSSSSSSSSTSATDSASRQEKLEKEIDACQKMKAGELKKELVERGVDVKSFFEKSEFVQALAKARVDGVAKKQESNEVKYADVEVLTDVNAGPRTKKPEADQQAQSPFGGGGGSPFGGGGVNPMDAMGGMGGMGGIADMLKNFGGGGGGAGAGNPFGGAGGGSPFGGMGDMGNMMGKAQEMMKNPKVMEIVAKAQKNPKISKAVQECMGNPAAFAKYQSDPEIAEVINELKKYM